MTSPRPPRRGLLPPPGKLVRLWPRIRPYRGPLALALVTLLGSGAITLAFPKLGGKLLDAAFQAHDRALLDRIALGLFLLFVVQAALNYAQTYLLTATGERAVAGLRRELFGKLLELPPGFFADRRTGELTSRLTADIGMLQGAMSTQVAELARQSLQLVGSLVLLTISQPRLTLTALAVAPVVIATAVFFGRRLRRMTTGLSDQVAEATAQAEEAFSQIRTVQSFVQEPGERSRYGARIDRVVATALRRAHLRGLFFGAITLAVFGAIVVVSGLGATILGGWLGDKLRDRWPGAYFGVSGYSTLLAFPFFLAMLYVPFPAAWGMIFAAVFLLFANTGPTNTILANVTPSAFRPTFSAAGPTSAAPSATSPPKVPASVLPRPTFIPASHWSGTSASPPKISETCSPRTASKVSAARPSAGQS